MVFPRLRAATEAAPPAAEDSPRGPISSGSADLDTLLGGGLERGTSAGLIGPPGYGKSTPACAFALAAARRGERAALYLFHESVSTFRLRAASQGLDPETPTTAGLFSLRQVDPTELSPGELADMLAREVESEIARLVVVDSLNGYLESMPEEQLLGLHVQSLLGHLSSRRAVTLVTLAQPSPLVRARGASIDLSYLADTVIAQRYFEAFGTIRCALSVLKKRYGNHERTTREYRIGAGDIEIGKPPSEFRGVLTGVPNPSCDLARRVPTAGVPSAREVLVLAPTPGDAALCRRYLAEAGLEAEVCEDTACAT